MASYSLGSAFTTNPAFSFLDSGFTIPASGSVTYHDANSALVGTKTQTFTSGVIVPTGLSINTAQASDTITASYSTTLITQDVLNFTATTQPFAVAAAVDHFTLTGYSSPATAGASALPLQVQAVDTYGNGISGVVLSFVSSGSGIHGDGATFSPASCTTGTNGMCSVTATANPFASTSSYNALVSNAGNTVSTTFTLTNKKASPTLTVTASPTTLVYGQPVTITATGSIPSVTGGGRRRRPVSR